ncbi:sulfotransferase [Zobellella taiwanensis]
MNYKHIFIITYGRTGSTLLQGILNTHDEVIIKGENLNFCHGIFKSYLALKETIEKHGNAKIPSHPFFGSHELDLKKFLNDAYTLIKNQLIKNDDLSTWGFKEIRYTPSRISDENGFILLDYLDFMNLLFPNSAFLFLTRKHTDVIDSAFWRRLEKNKALYEINKFEEVAKTWSQDKNNTFWIDYSHLKENNSKLIEMHDFLGLSYQALRIKKVINTEHSYTGKTENLLHLKNWNLKKHNSSNIQFHTIDKIPIKIEKNSSFELGGIILINESIKNNFEITIEHEGEPANIRWSIISPHYKKKYPLNPHSEKCRFSITNLKATETPVKIFIENKNQKELLFELKISL